MWIGHLWEIIKLMFRALALVSERSLKTSAVQFRQNAIATVELPNGERNPKPRITLQL